MIRTNFRIDKGVDDFKLVNFDVCNQKRPLVWIFHGLSKFWMQWLLYGGEQYVRIHLGPVKAESRIIPNTLDPEWNQTFAIGRDKTQGGNLELSVWDAVMDQFTWINPSYVFKKNES